MLAPEGRFQKEIFGKSLKLQGFYLDSKTGDDLGIGSKSRAEWHSCAGP